MKNICIVQAIMYLRKTKRKNKDGSVAQYYQLAHNERHPVTGKSTARIIHSFGRTDTLDREALVRLCRSIARVCGLNVIDPLTGDGEKGGGTPGSSPAGDCQHAGGGAEEA